MPARRVASNYHISYVHVPFVTSEYCFSMWHGWLKHWALLRSCSRLKSASARVVFASFCVVVFVFWAGERLRVGMCSVVEACVVLLGGCW